MAIQWHGAPFPLTSVYKYGCGSERWGADLHSQCRLGDDEEFEVDWAWWMLIDDTVCPELHNELVAQVFHTSANRAWLLPFVLYSSVEESLHVSVFFVINCEILSWTTAKCSMCKGKKNTFGILLLPLWLSYYLIRCSIPRVFFTWLSYKTHHQG